MCLVFGRSRLKRRTENCIKTVLYCFCRIPDTSWKLSHLLHGSELKYFHVYCCHNSNSVINSSDNLRDYHNNAMIVKKSGSEEGLEIVDQKCLVGAFGSYEAHYFVKAALPAECKRI